MTEQFWTIYYSRQNDKIIPFLKSLTAKDKKEIAKELKKLEGKKKEEINIDIFWMTALVCCTKVQFKALTQWYNNDISEFVDEVLAWYCPDWFSEIYNKIAEESWFYIHYSNLVRWQQKGYLHPSDKLIARNLVSSISNWSEKKIPIPDVIEKYPITLDEHIWTIFEQETSILWADTNRYNNQESQNLWKDIFLQHSKTGRIDRLRLLRACLNTIIYDFKRDLAGWYVDLLVYLQPTEEELLTLQDELFATFMGKHPKMINQALDFIKKIAAHEDFHSDDFISRTGLLLSSEVKSIINSSLSVLDKTAKSHKEKQEVICINLPLTFLNKDEAIQAKAAKMIIQYGNTASEELKEVLLAYNSSILMSIKEILKDYLGNEKLTPETSINEIAFDKIQITDDSRLIPAPQTMDDLIFFLLQLFENGEPHQIDILPAALINLTKEINESNINQLELALRKAYGICLSQPFHHMFDRQTKEFEKTYFWGAGSYYNLAALFFVNYCQYLATLYPRNSGFIRELHESATEEDKRKAKATKGGLFQYDRQITPLKEWIYSKYKLFYAYHRVMLQALTFIENNIRLPLLSTPTHYPAWIAPEALTDRLAEYQQANQKPDPADLQLALSRIAPESTSELINLGTEKLTDQYKTPIFSFFSEGQSKNKERKSFFSIFSKEKISCSLSDVNNYTGSYSWKIADEKKKDNTYTERLILEMSIPQSPWLEENNHYAGISDRLRLCISTQDVKNLIFSYPNTPVIPFALIVKDRFEFAQIPDAEFRDFLTASVAALFDLKVKINSATSLFMACCMLCSEKTIRNYAAEIWIERTANDLIDNTELGTHIGRLEKEEWAPLKRFTDLMIGNMMGISRKHYKAAQELVEAILPHLNGKSVKNLKKLQEIGNELRSLNMDSELTK